MLNAEKGIAIVGEMFCQSTGVCVTDDHGTFSGRADGWTGGRTDGRAVGRTVERTDGRADRRTGGRTDCVDERVISDRPYGKDAWTL